MAAIARGRRRDGRPGRAGPVGRLRAAGVAAGVVVGLAAGACAAPAAKTNAAFVERVRRDVAWLARGPSRVVGYPGHDRALKRLLAEVRAIPGVSVWTQEFTVLVPKVRQVGGVRRATLTVPAGARGGVHAVYPLWPASVRLNTTPTGGVSGRLVYVGRADPADVPARSLRGQIAVMEMTGGPGWQRAFNAGARAILLLGSPDEDAADARSHLPRVPVNVPRFYVPAGPLADALRAGRVPAGTIHAEMDWRPVRATNVWVLVPPAGPQAQPRQALAFVAPFDAMSVVPELAPGADAAVDAAVVLNLVRRLAARRPARPVLGVFLDAWAINQRGLREMLTALAVEDDERRALLRDDTDRVEAYRRHERLAAEADAADPLGAFSGGGYRPLRRYVKDEVAREVVAIETEMHPKRLRLHSMPPGADKERLRQEVDALGARRAELFGAQRRLLDAADVRDEVAALAGVLWRRARWRIRRQLDEAEAQLDQYRTRRRLRDELLARLGLTGQTQRPLAFYLGLDLSDAGVAVGPLAFCRYWNNTERKNAQPFRTWLGKTRRREAESVWPGGLRKAVNLRPLLGIEAAASFSAGDVASLDYPAASWGTPAATWATLDADRPRVDTPQDRPERLDWRRLGPQVEATRRLVDRMVTRTDLAVTVKVQPRWNRVEGRIVDVSPGEPVARLPMDGYLTTLVHGRCRGGRVVLHWRADVPGIRRQEFVRTGTDGRFRFDDVYVHPISSWCEYVVQSYRLDEHGRIVRALDLRKSGRGVRLDVNVQSKTLPPLRGVAFTCQELSGVELFDPRFLQHLPAGSLFDARRGTEPQRINFCLYQGQMACQLEPGTRWQLVLRSGIARNRMALLNMIDPNDPSAARRTVRESIRGFEADQRLPLHPLHVSARDLYRLDRRRLRDYRRAGIVSEPIEKLQERTGRLMAEADRALAADDGARLHRAVTGALANEIRAYQGVRDTADDVIRGAIFLLLALVPFSFAMERLLFASPRVYRQIGAMLGVFAVMTAVLWSFHPAFRISSQPLMVVMAFAIIFMSLLVLGVVYSRFESGLAEMRSGRAESSGAQTSRTGVLVTAARLGIANMRRRKLRTALTGAAVVLITFSLLCFMSTRSYTGRKQLSVSGEARYTGVLIRQPSRRPLSEEARPLLRNVLGAGRTMAVRYWWCNPYEEGWRLHVRSAETGRQISLAAGLGLSGDEARLIGLHRVCPNWRRFAASGGCYLARSAAEELGLVAPGGALAPGRRVVIAGKELAVVGVYDAAELDKLAFDLDGESMMPTDFDSLSDEQRKVVRDTKLEVITAAMEGGAALTEEQLPALSSASVVIVPARMLHGLRDAQLRSVAVPAADAAEAETLARELTDRLAFPIYYGSPAGTKAVASTPLLPSAPKALLIPLLIGGLMIFNTMLSSIAERKREVYIYTSLGLAPLHVGALFLAEAVTYGLMGAVFGYIVGQGAATVLGGLGLMGSLTLNYSGTQAVAVMLLVLAVVVLSSMVPAYLAGRLAAPSSERTWRVPEPDGDVIRDALPFTVTARTANGVLRFLLEYLDAHREGSIGHFSTDELRTFRFQAGPLEAMGIRGTVWLAPYDLGVRQDVTITIRPTDLEDVYGIHVELVRGSGQMRSFRGLNRTFLGDLRRQLLGWRRLKVQRVLRYVAEGRELLARTRKEAG